MGRIFVLLFAVVLVLGCVGMVVLGAFPPGARTEQVQKVLPNDKFQPR